MGASETLSSKPNSNYIDSQYIVQQKSSSETLGEFFIITQKDTQKKFILKQTEFHSSSDFNDGLDSLQKKAVISHPNIIGIDKIKVLSDVGFCSNIYKIL